jgi:ATP-dependent DNA ligase
MFGCICGLDGSISIEQDCPSVSPAYAFITNRDDITNYVILGLMAQVLKQPYLPMEAVSVSVIPVGPGWQYEPKWDGFRCLAFKDGNKIELQSKSQKPLTAYFPEVVDALRAVKPATCVLDGELVIPVNGELSFDHLLMRLSRGEGGPRRQAAQYPAVFFVFDILSDEEGRLLTGEPLGKRRLELERFAAGYLDENGTIRLSPATEDIEVARKWFGLAGGSLDGIVAKRIDVGYQPGTTRSVQKIKQRRTADCVVGGVILGAGGKSVSHVLLGLYEDGLLHFIGSAPLKAAEGKRLAGMLGDLIQPPGFTGRLPAEVRAQFGYRISEWHPLAPKLVAEVEYGHFTGGRFRHGSKFLRWRPDKEISGCTIDQVSGYTKG